MINRQEGIVVTKSYIHLAGSYGWISNFRSLGEYLSQSEAYEAEVPIVLTFVIQ